jgi:hypothetical protein
MKHLSSYWQWTRSARAKQLFSLCRWLHIYISTALFTLLIFFSVTGITLNHADWFSSTDNTRLTTLTLPYHIQQQLDNQQLSAIADTQLWLTAELGLEAPRSVNTDWALGEITFDYPLPAGYVFASVFITDGVIEIESKRGSLLALLNDLHKGRHSGAGWSWLIDISALLICLFALTGLIILLQHKRYRHTGLIAAACGTLAPWLLYLAVVPRLTD